MIIYYSGSGSRKDNPEVTLGDKANVMLSFYGSSKKGKPEKRFRRILKVRRRRQNENQS